MSQASRDAIRLDRHPGVFLYLTAEPGAVDVNVSPGKTQVRFADSATAFRLVYHALNSALLAGKEERRLRPVPSGSTGCRSVGTDTPSSWRLGPSGCS